MKKFAPVPIILLLFTLTSITFAHYEHFEIPTATITIDGNMDDWNDIEPVSVDDINDENQDANYEGYDIHKVYLAKDDTFLYCMMTLYDGAPAAAGFNSQYGFAPSQYPSEFDIKGDRNCGAFYNSGGWSACVYETIVNHSEWEKISCYSSKYVGVGSNFIEWKVYLEDIGALNEKFIIFWTNINIQGDRDWDYTYIHIVDEDATSTTPKPTATPTPTTGTGIIYGTVTDDEGFPFKNVSVSMTGANSYSKSTKTDKEGYYEFTGLAAGDYTLTYEKDGYQAKTQEVSLEEDETLEVETIYMEETEKGAISGYVTTIYGDPIESVKLRLKGIRTKAIKAESTDADGFFEFNDLDADDYMITATKKRYKSARKTVTIEEGDATEIEIEMKKTTKRRGVILIKESTHPLVPSQEGI